MNLLAILLSGLVSFANANGSLEDYNHGSEATNIEAGNIGANNMVEDSYNTESSINGENSYSTETSNPYLAENSESLETSENIQFTEPREPAALNSDREPAALNSEREGLVQAKAGVVPTLPAYVQYYQRRYPLTDTFTKIVDNRGNGFVDLYGVRNFRTVLNGVLYRGGANNAFNKNKVRDNKNPLPAEGIANLCKEGFRNVYYMYSTNYDKSSNPMKCKTERGPDNKLDISMSYLQKGPWDRKTQHDILKTVYDNINNPNAGPVYLHCWNGWHASGLISSFALRQFCNYSGEQAVKYWDMNTDGNNKGKSYDSYRSQIKSFIQFNDLKLSDDIMKQICLPPPAVGV